MDNIERNTKVLLNYNLDKLEKHFNSNVIFYYGPIHPMLEKEFKICIEELIHQERIEQPDRSASLKETLTIFLNTSGSAETVEKLVRITRFHYKKVNFVVPDQAMSAGTIFCMSGNHIYMNYASSLGPIDPQVFNGKDWVPALGYLDQVEKLIEKAKNGTITNPEVLILQSLDLALLNQYEQQKNLTITLLKDWLVRYKFEDWKTHETNPAKKDQLVTLEEKNERAEEIAIKLSDNKYWHSHGRKIDIDSLKNFIRLKIIDYSNDDNLFTEIRNYNDLFVDYVNYKKFIWMFHSKYNFYS